LKAEFDILDDQALDRFIEIHENKTKLNSLEEV
jgi:hypothetical protein